MTDEQWRQMDQIINNTIHNIYNLLHTKYGLLDLNKDTTEIILDNLDKEKYFTIHYNNYNHNNFNINDFKIHIIRFEN